MQTVTVSVDSLDLWTHNPRVEESTNQNDALKKIYDSSNPSSLQSSHRQLMKLAQSIAENGYQNPIEPILATREGNRYVVQDANRRLSAIRLLSHPDAYTSILTSNDLEKLTLWNKEFSGNIPSKLDIVVFEESEAEKLKEILARKHDGPLDGAGTQPWSSEAKKRFFKKDKDLASKLEQPFESQYSKTLTNYMGGSRAVTSTARIFNMKKVKEFLNVHDSEQITQEDLAKVKLVADAVKDYTDRNNILPSRLTAKIVSEKILTPLSSKTPLKPPTPKEIVQANAANFVPKKAMSYESHLGSRFFDTRLLRTSDNNFESVNIILFGLQQYGDLREEENDRLLKSFLLAPSIRVIFELSLLGLRESGVKLYQAGVSDNHEKNVSSVISLFTHKQFIKAVCENSIVFDGFKQAENIIQTSDFPNTVVRSHLSSHSGGRAMNVEEIKQMFDIAVLFAELSQFYISYINN